MPKTNQQTRPSAARPGGISHLTSGGENNQSLTAFVQSRIDHLYSTGSAGTAANYKYLLNSLRKFTGGGDISFASLDEDFILRYQAHLRKTMQPNSSSRYLRNLRTLYYSAADSGLVERSDIFRHSYCGFEKTRKRAIALQYLRGMKDADLTAIPSLDFARDMFLFSFLMRGMSFVDIAHLKKSDLKGGVVTYVRKKTGRTMTVKWERQMQDIVDKYALQTKDSPYMLPLITRPGSKEYLQCNSACRKVNKNLKKLGAMLGLDEPLTTYVARHTWASVMHADNCPISLISAALGHESEITTKIYLKDIDMAAIDEANSRIINSI